MTTFAQPIPVIGASTLAKRVKRRLLDVLPRWQVRRTCIELRQLDDHMLRDIGLRRDQIGEMFGSSSHLIGRAPAL